MAPWERGSLTRIAWRRRWGLRPRRPHFQSFCALLGRGTRGGPSRRRVSQLASTCFGALLLLVAPLEAQRQQDRLNAAEAEGAIAQLRSPYCPGLMLEVCPSTPAAALRDSIYELAAQGLTSADLVEWMISRHGEEWRGVPERSGLGLWAWVIPPLGLLLGMGALLTWMRGHRTSEGSSVPASATSVSEADRAELATALRDWEDSGAEDV